MADAEAGESVSRPQPTPGVTWIARGLEALFDDLPFTAEGATAPSDPDFDADLVIVGSGYGAAVAARQFAGCTLGGKALRIAVLERGDEYLSGAFPSRLADLPGHVRFSTPDSPTPKGRRSGLFDVRVGADVMALVANGVGGGSLINAGVMLEPDPAVFRQARWPALFHQDGLLRPHFDTVRAWLGAEARGQANTVADTPLDGLGKTRALKKLHPTRASVVPITVALRDGTRSVAGVPLAQCVACGDCATGCNHGAKNSLDVGLLAQACATQAEGGNQPDRARLYAGATVLWLEKQADGQWIVVLQHTDNKLRLRQARPFRLRARFVVLAAGTLGSTEILLRSRQHGLALSPRLGERFSVNGDRIASLQGLKDEVDAVADEAKAPGTRQVGPTITAMVDQREGASGFVVQDLAVPGAMRQVFAELFTTAGVLHALPECDRQAHTPQDMDPCAVDDDAIGRRTLPVAMIGHDDSGGRLSLVSAQSVASASGSMADAEGDGALRIDWPQLKDDPCWQQQHEQLGKLPGRSALGGRVLPNPAWQLLPDGLQDALSVPRGPMITVHPLGGCVMGNHPGQGVVDEIGRVFDAIDTASGAARTHFGLAVLDGAIVPTSLGINPALTIAALAHRAAAALRPAWGLGEPAKLADDRGPRPVFGPTLPDRPATPTRIELVERMRGRARLSDGLDAWIELTLFSKPTALRGLAQQQPQRSLAFDAARSTLRVYRGDLPPLDDEPTGDKVLLLLEARVSGTLTIFRREPSQSWPRTRRAVRAWWRNRGLRDTYQKWAKGDPGGRGIGGWFTVIRQTLALASRAGAVRTLDYDLQVHAPTTHCRVVGAEAALAAQLRTVTGLTGVKRLRYDLQASPLQQLMEMELASPWPGLAPGQRPMLELHLPFLAQQAVPLMRVVGQADQPTALADLAAFLAYVGRILIDGHLWSFRKPDPASRRKPQRLPGAVQGAPQPEWTEIELAPARPADPLAGTRAVPAARIRLTRYCPGQPDPSLPPVLLIHGYSASGTTFAHPVLPHGLMPTLTGACRDVWVLDMRSSCGMPSAEHPWAFEDMGCEDIPVAVEHVCAATGFEQVDIVAHCMGVAMLFMGLLGKNRFVGGQLLLPRLGAHERLRHKLWDRDLLHWKGEHDNNDFDVRVQSPARSRIRRLVISQVGPALLLTPANIARAYLMRYAQQFIGGQYAFTPDETGGLANQLIDRLLSGLPYPPGEFERENPYWPPCQPRTWVGTRHRIDALFGRVFNLANMDDATLDHIDDFFGPFNVDTVSQVMYFARYWLITDRSGFNRFVDVKALRERLTFPILSLHAGANGLADPATGCLMQQQIEPNLGPGGSLTVRRFDGGQLGHQDSLIGKQTATEPVFAQILGFFRRADPAGADHAA